MTTTMEIYEKSLSNIYSFHSHVSCIFDESCWICIINRCEWKFFRNQLYQFHCTCTFNHQPYWFVSVPYFNGVFCLCHGKTKNSQFPSVMSVSIPYHRYDNQHFDACTMLLQTNTTRSKHGLHYICSICFGMLFFFHSNDQVYSFFCFVKNQRRQKKKIFIIHVVFKNITVWIFYAHLCIDIKSLLPFYFLLKKQPKKNKTMNQNN